MDSNCVGKIKTLGTRVIKDFCILWILDTFQGLGGRNTFERKKKKKLFKMCFTNVLLRANAVYIALVWASLQLLTFKALLFKLYFFHFCSRHLQFLVYWEYINSL